MELEYFVEVMTDRLFAYGSFYEFFEIYDEQSKAWKTSPISYSRFLHDYMFREISKEQAAEITDGNLPEQAYKNYRKLFGG